uniref:Uncharacterized protein n=1 Tax=viral metagenome TaxID=1070528 RepID=A0A6C0J7R3_9ZZZZ
MYDYKGNVPIHLSLMKTRTELSKLVDSFPLNPWNTTISCIPLHKKLETVLCSQSCMWYDSKI